MKTEIKNRRIKLFKVTVIVKRRPKILDPEGKAVEQGAKLLGFNNVKKTRIVSTLNSLLIPKIK